MTDNNGMAVQNALQGAGIQFAMPQRLEPVTNKKHQVQRVVYDPQKLQALKDALSLQRPTMGTWESFANSLSNVPEVRSFTGGFGEEIINPWAVGLSSLARGFGGAYSARKASEREAEEKAREDAIKAAQMDLEASKQQISDTTEDTQMKVNDPNAKAYQDAQEKIKALQTVQMMMNQLEDIGTRIDEDYKSIDDMQQNSTRAGRSLKGAGYGIGRTAGERQADNEYNAWVGSIKNVLVNANKQAGSGSMSDADAARYEQGIAQAKSLPEAREIMRSFYSRLSMTPISNQQKAIEENDIEKWMKGVR